MPEKIPVAVVDDDRGTRELIAEQIRENARYECVQIHENPESAITGLLQHPPAIVLMDINMPGQTGIETVRQLKPKLPDTDFVMLTVYDDTEHIFEALAAGAVGYLLKRSVGENLIDALDDAVAGGSPMDSDIARKVVQSFQKPVQKPHDDIAGLSERELQVLHLLARGRLYKEISDELDISIHTVHTYIRRIYEKLHVHSRSEAVARLTGIS
jgi:DNA-binding NarL/FixJ family response regulator